jgi:hypothetical protein
MAYRPKIVKYTVIPSAQASPANTSSMAASINGAPSVIEGLSMMSYQVDWSASTAVGAASVQVSNNFALNAEGQVANAGTWITLPFNDAGTTVTSIPITGASGTGGMDIDATGFYAIRFVYTATSGSGTLAVVFNAKVA